MRKEVAENHKAYLGRNDLFKSFGYDLDRDRDLVIEEALPLSGRILEAGTGKGHFAIALARKGYRFVSFDISEEEQRVAKLNLEYFELEKYVDLRIENAEKTSFEDGSFDVIMSVNVLHHLNDPNMVIDELVRILSPNGKLVISDFTEEGFLIMDKIHALDGNTHKRGQVRLMDVKRSMERTGFITRTKTVGHQEILIAKRGQLKK